MFGFRGGGDAIAEPTETFTVALQLPNGVAARGTTVGIGALIATGTILDNDTATVSIADTSVTELLARISGDRVTLRTLEEAYLELTQNAVEYRAAPGQEASR